MNVILEQYKLIRRGLLPDYHGQLAEQTIQTLSQHIPEAMHEKVAEEIRGARREVEKLVTRDEDRSRYGEETSYLAHLNRHLEHKKAYEENTPFTP